MLDSEVGCEAFAERLRPGVVLQRERKNNMNMMAVLNEDKQTILRFRTSGALRLQQDDDGTRLMKTNIAHQDRQQEPTCHRMRLATNPDNH